MLLVLKSLPHLILYCFDVPRRTVWVALSKEQITEMPER